jgi:acyl carrier protein
MTADPILERVQALVTEVAGPERAPADADPDTPLGDSGYWLDSVDVLEVILACEREFGTVFEEGADLTPDTLYSARRLADLVRSKLSA